MNTILKYIGDIEDAFLLEAETADIAGNVAMKRRIVKYSAIGLLISLFVGVIVWLYSKTKSFNKITQSTIDQ